MEHYLLPYDFSASAENALDYTLRLAEGQTRKITLLHVINTEGERPDAEKRFAETIARIGGKNAEGIDCVVVKGELQTAIPDAARQRQATLVIMGVKSHSYFEKVFGITAVKIITDTTIPFMLIQEGSTFHPIKKIGMTLDVKHESTQVIESIVNLSQRLGAEVVLIGGDHQKPELKKQVQNNLNEVHSILSSNGVASTTQLLERKGFEDKLFAYAKENDIGIIAATYYAHSANVFTAGFVEKLIDNKAGIPILVKGKTATPKFAAFFNHIVCPISYKKIDSNVSRLTVFTNVLLMVAFLITYEPVLAWIVTADYFIRAVVKVEFSPIRFMALHIVRAIKLKPKRIGKAQKVFASRLGMLCAIASVIFLYLEMPVGSMIAMGMLMVLSFADSVLNFCVGCLIYNYLVYPIYKNR